MRVKIISDSTCDLSPALLERYDIAVTPLCVIKDSKDFHGIILEMKALGYDEPVTYERDADTMTIHAPFVKSDMPVVYRMKLK